MGTPQGGFDVNRLSTGQKILLGGGIVYLIVLFFPWFGADLGDFGDILGVNIPDVNVNGWTGGFGMLSGVFVIALLAWEGMAAAGVKLGAVSPALGGAILGGLVAVCGILNVLFNLSVAKVGAWIGIVVALALLYGAYVRFQESKVGTAPPPPAA